ncbi:ethylbenzene dehydrogenase-related protein [Psychromonas ossibalaenae]|uniref:ethylbenzene dehydrogenase-related protein n=1 Tax=Psychromonas ossibalaenae TaxID=444922 RepID=UPI000376CAA0|nr:ethylbenzene dehydrogenase-related protein [Psychromonas ossibalaenae]
MKRSTSIIASTVIAFSILPFAAQAKTTTLQSVKSMSAVNIDGVADAAWNKAPGVKVKLKKLPYKPNNGYTGIKKTTVEMKSLYDDQYIYFLMTYKDPTHSMNRFPWMEQEDGSWKQLKNIDDTGHDNTFYEDKFAILWDINSDGFAKKGCNAACHRASDGEIDGIKTKSPARKYTKPGQTIDMWHWKGVRTNPNGQQDDQYIDSNKDPKKNKGWGRKGDHKTGGGYVNNVDNKQPKFVAPMPTEDAVVIFDSEKQPFTAGYNKTKRIPGIITKPFTGSRGDITTVGVWKDGVWTLEMKRKLVTTGKHADTQDVQFNDMNKVYPFGIAVFDNSQINHIFHRGVLNLKFK